MSDGVVSGFRGYEPHDKASWERLPSHVRALWGDFLNGWRDECRSKVPEFRPPTTSEMVAIVLKDAPVGRRPFIKIEDDFIREKYLIWTAKAIAAVLKREAEDVRWRANHLGVRKWTFTRER